jgi:hypothetical protein
MAKVRWAPSGFKVGAPVRNVRLRRETKQEGEGSAEKRKDASWGGFFCVGPVCWR